MSKKKAAPSKLGQEFDAVKCDFEVDLAVLRRSVEKSTNWAKEDGFPVGRSPLERQQFIDRYFKSWMEYSECTVIELYAGEVERAFSRVERSYRSQRKELADYFKEMLATPELKDQVCDLLSDYLGRLLSNTGVHKPANIFFHMMKAFRHYPEVRPAFTPYIAKAIQSSGYEVQDHSVVATVTASGDSPVVPFDGQPSGVVSERNKRSLPILEIARNFQEWREAVSAHDLETAIQQILAEQSTRSPLKELMELFVEAIVKKKEKKREKPLFLLFQISLGRSTEQWRAHIADSPAMHILLKRADEETLQKIRGIIRGCAVYERAFATYLRDVPGAEEKPEPSTFGL